MSGLLFQYIMRVIREEKVRSPKDFPDYSPPPEIISDRQTVRDRIEARYESFGGKTLSQDQLDKMIDKIAELLEVVEVTNESGENK